MPYEPVVPREHDPRCRRGIYPRYAHREPRSDAVSDYRHFGLDRERCERCRNLWQRLDDVRAARIVAVRNTLSSSPTTAA